MKTYCWSQLTSDESKALLQRPAIVVDKKIRTTVIGIIDQVRERGDQALFDLTKELDGVALTSLRVTEEEFLAAPGKLTSEQLNALTVARANIQLFHEAQIPDPIRVETAAGVSCERVSRAISSVGLYVPAGTAPLPSTALMLAIPAALAGCQNRLMCTPAQSDGRADPAVLVAARACGVQKVFKLGGAQAIAAMAYGTDSVPKVEKIFGPGNAWVTAAKAQVAQDPLGAARRLRSCSSRSGCHRARAPFVPASRGCSPTG